MLYKSWNSKLALMAASALVISACSSERPATPVCRVNDTQVDDATGNAGCFIRVKDKLVTVVLQTGKLDIPGGTANEGEQSQCTAHRETFEETGFNVEVGKLLGLADTGFRMYQCELSNKLDEDLEEFPVPDWANTEIRKIQLVDPFDTLASEWRYPQRHLENLGWFNQTKTDAEE